LAKNWVPFGVSLPPSIIRLTAVLAEISHNEATTTPTTESIHFPADKTEGDSKNLSGGQKK
jgi:hypothetical protein